MGEGGQHAAIGLLQGVGHALRQSAKLVGVRQPAAFFLERFGLARRELGLFDLASDVPQIVGAPLCVGRTATQRLDFRLERMHGVVAIANDGRGGRGAGERVEQIALRVRIEQRLRFVLAVQIHQRSTDIGQHARRGRCVVDPGTRAPRRSNLAPQHDQVIVRVDAVRIEQRPHCGVGADVERALHRRLVGAGADDVGARAFA